MSVAATRGRAVRVFAALAVAVTTSSGGEPAGAARAVEPCTRRVMQVVAHEDDDLLFMNPDVARDVAAGLCVRTVYLTAGDAGRDLRYWSRREAGERAAYARMARTADEWTTADAGVPGTPIPVLTLARNPNVSLVFLRLPDGGVGGDGFASNGYATLSKLWDGGIPALTTVDPTRPVTYTRPDLVATLSRLMSGYRPDTVRIQDCGGDHDHSDHIAAAALATAASEAYPAPHALVRYVDYATLHRAPNVSGRDLAEKKAAFYAYAAHDPHVCDSDVECASGGPRYAVWLRRQYVAREAHACGDGAAGG